MTDNLETSITSLGATTNILAEAREATRLREEATTVLPKVDAKPIRIGGYTIVPKCACRIVQKRVKDEYEKDWDGRVKLDRHDKPIPLYEYVSCGKTVRIPNHLFDTNPDAVWFRKYHDPRFHNSSVTFKNPETV